jgi:hypothetical protein
MVQHLFSASVSIPSDVMLQQLPERESVCLNLETEEYFGLDPVGTRMWLALAAAPTVEGAYRTLLEEFDVEPTRLRGELADFVSELVQRRLLAVDER